MNYKEFLETKKKSHIDSGFEIDESKLSSHLFDFQKFAVKLCELVPQFQRKEWYCD